ncbi:Mobile element protein [Mameliella alba]|uniref:Mobile element protein n=1 Tax=Mameliella alba TaxID=561184 RepID=A0A0B3SBB6_9RHOB|nr:Mobile element protein [Mameliella alba]
MIGAFRPQTHTRPVVQPESPFLLLFLWHFQPFASPDTLNPLVVHMPARVVQQAGHHAIAVAPVLIGQFDDVVGQTLIFGPALRHLALRGSVLPERAAGAAL